MLGRVTAALRHSIAAPAYVECRDCGTTLDRPVGVCTACGSAEVARYDIDE